MFVLGNVSCISQEKIFRWGLREYVEILIQRVVHNVRKHNANGASVDLSFPLKSFIQSYINDAFKDKRLTGQYDIRVHHWLSADTLGDNYGVEIVYITKDGDKDQHRIRFAVDHHNNLFFK